MAGARVGITAREFLERPDAAWVRHLCRWQGALWLRKRTRGPDAVAAESGRTRRLEECAVGRRAHGPRYSVQRDVMWSARHCTGGAPGHSVTFDLP